MSQAIKFLAQNKHLLVDVIEEETEENSSIALPEGYKKQENPFKIGIILNAQEDSYFYDHIGSYVLFPSNVLETISLHGINIKTIPSHSVYGILKNLES